MMGILDRALDRTYDVQVRGQPIGTYQTDKPVETAPIGKLTTVRKYLEASGGLTLTCPKQHNLLIKSITANMTAINADAAERKIEITHYFNPDEDNAGRFREFFLMRRVWNTAAGGGAWVYCNPILGLGNFINPAATLDLNEYQYVPKNIEYIDQGEQLRVYVTLREAADRAQAEIQYYDVQLK